MIFVDTGAWFASVVPWDANHAGAVAWLSQNQETLITTDYIADETLTLLRVRKESARALAFGEQLFSRQLAELYLLQEADLHEAWRGMVEEIFVKRVYPPLPLPPGQVRVILDVGANIGCSCVWFRALYPGAAIFALEPDRQAFLYLQANTEVPLLRDLEAFLERVDAVMLEYHSERDRLEVDHLLSQHARLHRLRR